MKKLFLVGALAFFGAMNAQTSNSGATAKGKWVIETNAGSPLHIIGGNTAFSLTAVDGETVWNVGLEGGHFIADNFALKAGLGYGSYGGDGMFTYRLGAQYYINGMLPVAADFTGVSADGESINYVGLEGGYAWFVSPNIAITPKLRYNLSLNSDMAQNSFQGLIGFSLFF